MKLLHSELGDWKKVYAFALATAGKLRLKHYPTPAQKSAFLLAEESPLRAYVVFAIFEIPYSAAIHLRTHGIGASWAIQSQRPDLTGKERDPEAVVKVALTANLQAFINISSERLCQKTAERTRQEWRALIDTLFETEPEIRAALVAKCVRFGKCKMGSRGCK